MPLQPNTTLGPYQISGLLGEGGMGVVYRAKDTRLGRDVAIKVLTNVTLSDRERLQRFEQEARATGMLNHPNLLTIYDVGRDAEGNPFLVSELLEGETLSSRLARGPLSARKAIDASLQMANGLAAAHEKGIVHRDLKPDNIFLTRDGRLKILDFGIAKLTGAAGAEGATFQMAATEPGMVLGTVGYMSPEQVRGEAVDHRSDLFSMGAIVYEMLTGARAFKRSSGIETLSAILKEDPPDLSEVLPNVPPALERLVRRCLEKDRELRFQTARDLAFHLETLSTMSTAHTLSGPPRAGEAPRVGAATSANAPKPPSPQAATPASTATARMQSAPTVRHTAVRPLTKLKRRVSPILLALLYLVSVGGAAYGGWLWAQRSRAEEVVEPQFRRLTFRRGEVRTARFSPDGQTVVYSAAWDGAQPEVFVVSRGATEARPLGVPHSEVLAVSKTSELAILLRRDRMSNLGTLARVPLAGGMPREIADHVLQADWSPDGASLAVVRQVDGKTRVEYPIGTTRYETPHFVRDVRIAPDGKRLAILEPSQGEWDVAIIDGGAPVTIARGWARGATNIAWSADGKEIWLSGTATAAPPALYAIDVETGDVRLVTRLTGGVRMFDLSPRGDALLSNGTWRAALMWSSGAPTAPAGQSAATTTGEAPAGPQETNAERDASWLDWSILAGLSPDGRTILFSETREGGGAKSAVYLRRADSPSPIHLGDGIGDGLSPDGKWALCHQGAKLVLMPTGTGQPRELAVAGAFDTGAVWLPDSRRVIVAGVIGNSGYRLFVIDTLDETATPISPPNIWSGGTRAFAVSPDGRFVAGMTAEQTIAVYAIDGSSATPVSGVEKGEVPVEWSADGAALFVHDPTELPARVHRVTLAGGAREPWKEFTPADPAGVYKIAPLLVTRDGSAYAYNAMRVLSDLYLAEGLK
jgi:serine/threonine protein kinase/Tol biopolymer transport system component